MSHVLYKAQDILIESMKLVLKKIPKARLLLVGDGENRKMLQIMCKDLGIEDKVIFSGYVKGGKEVFDMLDKSDLFVLPSRQEGLPRAMLEAFARGLPCIGSHVGGIPELLEDKFMVPPNNAEALSNLLIKVLSDSNLMASMSQINLEKSRSYSKEHFEKERLEYYKRILND